MFVGFLQQPGGGPCFLGNWDPEELSSLHSSPSPIHRHPFSATTSPTDPTDPREDGVGDDRCPSDPQRLDHGDVDHNPLNPARSLEYSPEESLERIRTSDIGIKVSANEPQNHIRPGVDTVQDDAEGSQLCPSPPETTGTVRQQTEKHFNLPTQRERRCSSSDSWLSSPELDDHSHERKSSSARQSRVTTHNNNNHIRLKSSEKGATSPPPPQASK